jgi:phosphoribosyl-AMP cyclohydrolase
MIKLDFSKNNGLVTAIAVDYENNDVLMVAYMNEDAFRLTLETGKVHYWSRSRNKLWKKGESSGNMQEVKEIYVDCDSDAVLIKVIQNGPACHEGYRSCFFRKVDGDNLEVIGERLEDPEKMYGKKQ